MKIGVLSGRRSFCGTVYCGTFGLASSYLQVATSLASACVECSAMATRVITSRRSICAKFGEVFSFCQGVFSGLIYVFPSVGGYSIELRYEYWGLDRLMGIIYSRGGVSGSVTLFRLFSGFQFLRRAPTGYGRFVEVLFLRYTRLSRATVSAGIYVLASDANIMSSGINYLFIYTFCVACFFWGAGRFFEIADVRLAAGYLGCYSW